MLAKPLLLDISIFLKNNGLTSGDGVDTFRDFTPEKPDSIVVLNEYTGDPVLTYVDEVHRSVQIVARSRDADEARSKVLSIFKLFKDKQDSVGKVTFTSERWGQVFLRQTPFKLQVDKNNRVYYAFNIGITTTIE